MEDTMITEEIKTTIWLIYDTTPLTLIRLEMPFSLNQASICMFSTITAFMGYYPQGSIAHTIVDAKLKYTFSHTVTPNGMKMNQI